MQKLSKFSDEELADIIRTKDNTAYAELIHRYQKKLLRYANALINDEDLAADAVQEGFIKAYINLNSFNSRLKFSSWLYRIVHNQAMNLVRKSKGNISTDEVLEMDSGINLEDELIKKEIKSHLHDCLNAMDLLYKIPLTLYFLEEKSYEEISDILRIPIGTVGTRINRAKTMVKKNMSKKTINLEKNIMDKVKSGQISIKPRWYFVFGSLLMTAGLISFSIGAIFLTNLSFFLLRQHGPMGHYRLQLMFENFSWWIPLLAIIGIVGGVWLLKKYDFSYKKNFGLIVISFVLSILVAAFIIDYSGLNDFCSHQGHMRGFYQRIKNQGSVSPTKKGGEQGGQRKFTFLGKKDIIE